MSMTANDISTLLDDMMQNAHAEPDVMYVLPSMMHRIKFWHAKGEKAVARRKRWHAIRNRQRKASQRRHNRGVA